MTLAFTIGGAEPDPASWADLMLPEPPAPPEPTPKRPRGTHPRANAKTQAIVDFLRDHGGHTARQIALATESPVHNTRSRLYELSQQRRIIKAENGRWVYNRFAPKAVRDGCL